MLGKEQPLRSSGKQSCHGVAAAVVLLCGMVWSGRAASAQQMGRTVSGRVTDRHHEPLAGAVVQVHSETTLSVVSYITGRDGNYIFKHLSPDDDYNVFAVYRGYRSKARRLSKFDSKTDRVYRLVIKLP
jgi:hypothetical protein